MATQVYHFAQILLQTTRLPVGGFREVVMRERLINEAIETICGIALHLLDDSASIISAGCIFVAGLNTKHQARRRAILDLLGTHKERTGFPLNDFRDELHAHWAKADLRLQPALTGTATPG